MQVLLNSDIEHVLIASCPGKTWAEKKSWYPVWVDQQYATTMIAYQGLWIPVDTKYLFTQSFNGVLDNNGTYHVRHELVDKVDISPEFTSFEEWVAAVQKRYDTDWPGSDCAKEMKFWKFGSYIQKREETNE